MSDLPKEITPSSTETTPLLYRDSEGDWMMVHGNGETYQVAMSGSPLGRAMDARIVGAPSEKPLRQPYSTIEPCFDHKVVACEVCKPEDWLCGAQHSRENAPRPDKAEGATPLTDAVVNSHLPDNGQRLALVYADLLKLCRNLERSLPVSATKDGLPALYFSEYWWVKRSNAKRAYASYARERRIESALQKFEDTPRGYPQAEIAAKLIAEIRAALA